MPAGRATLVAACSVSQLGRGEMISPVVNAGLKRIVDAEQTDSLADLRYIRRRCTRKEALRAAIAAVAQRELLRAPTRDLG